MVQRFKFWRISPTRFAETLQVFAVPLVFAAIQTWKALQDGWFSSIEPNPWPYLFLASAIATIWVELQPRFADRGLVRLGAGLAAAAAAWGLHQIAHIINKDTPALLMILIIGFYVLPTLGRGKTTRDFAGWLHQAVHAQIMAGVATGLLIGGIMLAVGSTEEIFGVDFYRDIYEDIGKIGIFFGFPLLTFLLLPNLLALTESIYIPRAQRVIMSYVQVPLVWLLLVLSYLYAGKALILWRPLTDSVVLHTMVGIALAGPFLHAVLACQDAQTTRFDRALHRCFFILVWVPIVTVAIYFARTITLYGLTYPRYWGVIALALAAATALYALIARSRYVFQYAVVAGLIACWLGSYSAWRDEVLVKQYRKISVPAEVKNASQIAGIHSVTGNAYHFGQNRLLATIMLNANRDEMQSEILCAEGDTVFCGLVMKIEGTDAVLLKNEQPLLRFPLKQLVDRIEKERASPAGTQREENVANMTYEQSSQSWHGTLLVNHIFVHFPKAEKNPSEKRIENVNMQLLLEYQP